MYEFQTELPDRLDRLLRHSSLPGKEWLSRHSWDALLAEGRVRVNGRVEKKSGQQISARAKIQIELPEMGLIPDPEAAICLWKSADFGLFEKPAGVATYPLLPWEKGTFAHQISGFLAQEKILSAAEFQALAEPPLLEGGIVQRLDTDTSGILAAAFTSSCKALFRKVFSQHEISKNYLAICHGKALSEGPHTIYLGQQGKVVQAQLQENPKFQKVEIQLRILAEKNDFRLVEIQTAFGLRHVVRASLAALDNPLVGDHAYRGHTESAKHHMLHALSMHSKNPELVIPTVKAALPKAFVETLHSLGLHYSG